MEEAHDFYQCFLRDNLEFVEDSFLYAVAKLNPVKRCGLQKTSKLNKIPNNTMPKFRIGSQPLSLGQKRQINFPLCAQKSVTKGRKLNGI